MVSLVYNPEVHLIGYPSVNEKELFYWIDSQGLSEVSEDNSTPLSSLVDHIMLDTNNVEDIIELAGRQCYSSYAKGRPSATYMENILESGHGSVLRHSVFNFAISGVSRNLTHELIRHAAGVAISQQSQRYVDANDIRFVPPPALLEMYNDPEQLEVFRSECEDAVERYVKWQAIYKSHFASAEPHERKKRTNEAARSVLPGCAETKLVWSANVQSLRFIIQTRGTIYADLEIRRLAVALLEKVKQYTSYLFADLDVFLDTDGRTSIKSTRGYPI